MKKNINTKHLKYFFICFFALYYATLAMAIWNKNFSYDIVDNVFSAVGELIALGIIIYGLMSQQIVIKRVWVLIAIVIACNLIGDGVYKVNEIVFSKKLSPVSICDLFYVPSAVLLLVAVLLLIHKERVYYNIKIGIDIAIIMVASATLLYNFILMPIWRNEAYSLFQKSILMLYPILDLGYLAGILIRFFNKKVKQRPSRQEVSFILGFLFIFMADMLFAIDKSTYLSLIYDPFWGIGFVCLAFAGLYTKENKAVVFSYKQEKRQKKKDFFDYILFLAPYLLAGLFIIIVSARYMFQDPLALGSTITVLMIFIRQIFTLLENDHLLEMFEKTNQQLEEYSLLLENKNEKLHELKNLREQQAQTDYLTHLYNRRFMNEWLDQYMENFSKEAIIELSILLIDVDHYKEVNDLFGHDTGDVVLKDIAYLIRKNIRQEDKASRYGGDEFIVILPNTKTKDAKQIAQRILKAVEKNTFEEKLDMTITLSIGNYYWAGTKEQYSFSQMIQSVDEALYEAKKTGRNKIVTK